MGGPFRGEHVQFLVQAVRGRWFMFFASLLVQAGGGTTYIYDLYSMEIKESLKYNEDAMSRMIFYRNIGANLAFFNGLLVEVIPTWLGLVVSGAMNFGGYFMVWLAVIKKIPRPKVWQMCAYIAFAVNSPNFSSTITLSICVQNFPTSRGVVLGLMKGLVGLSGAILTQIYVGIFDNDRKGLILLLGLLPASVSILFMFTIRKIENERRPNELRVFLNFFYMTILLALFLMFLPLLEKYDDNVAKDIQQKGAVAVTILLFLPLTLVIKEESAIWEHTKKTASPAPDQITIERPHASPVGSYTQLEEKAKGSKGSCFANIFNKPERGEDHTILQAILSIDMLYILIITLCGYGTALASLEQLRSIGVALQYDERRVSSMITVASIWNYCGRLYSGFLSEVLLIKWRLPRSMVMVFVLLLHGTGLLLVAFPAIPGTFYVASIILPFTLGAQVPLNLAMISELFGLKYYATLLNCAQVACPLWVYLMNTKLTKVLYENEAVRELVAAGKDPSREKELTCKGPNCFQVSYSILAAFAFVGALVSLQFAWRTREFYKGDIYKSFRAKKYRTEDTFKRYNGETYVRFEECDMAISEIEMAQPCHNGSGEKQGSILT